MTRSLSQIDQRLTDEILNRARAVDAEKTRATAAEKALADRIAKLEGITPQGPPPVTPPTTPPPTTGTYTKSGPISLTPADNGAVIEWKDLSSPNLDNSAIAIQGTSATNRIKNITLRHCRVSGFNNAFLLRWAENVLLEDCEIPLVGYAGFNVFSSNNVRIIRPLVTKVFRPGPYDPNSGAGNNAYGVKLDQYSRGDPVCDTVEVSDGRFLESKLWMALNAHGGHHVKFLRNEIHKTPRAIFAAGSDLADFDIVGNVLLEPATAAGGTTDVTAISYGGIKGGIIDQNQISRAYGSTVSKIDQYVGATSVGVLVGTNPSVP